MARTKIDKVTLNTVAESAATTSIQAFGIQVDDTHIFLSDGSRKLYKYNKADMSLLLTSSVFTNLVNFYCDKEDSGYIYFSNSVSVTKINKNFEVSNTFSWSVIKTISTTVRGDDNFIYIADSTNNKILRLEKSILILSAITSQFPDAISASIVCDSNFLYVINSIDKRIIKYDKVTTAPQYQITGYVKE